MAPQLVAKVPGMVTLAHGAAVTDAENDLADSPGLLQQPLKTGKEPSKSAVEQQCIPLSITNSKLPGGLFRMCFRCTCILAVSMLKSEFLFFSYVHLDIHDIVSLLAAPGILHRLLRRSFQPA